VLRFEDAKTGALREAFIAGGRVERILFITCTGGLPPREWLTDMFGLDGVTPEDRALLLVGRAPGARIETGPIVCACRAVRQARVEAAIAEGCRTIDAVGEATGAGSSCGSCRPEIARLIGHSAKPEVRHAA